jgi:hypothetical protein
MDMQDRSIIFIRGEDPYAGHLMRAVYGKQHRFGGHLFGVARTNYYLTSAYSTYKDDMADGDTFFLGEVFNAFRKNVVIFKAKYKDTT